MATRQSNSSAFQNAQSVLRFSQESTGSRSGRRTGQLHEIRPFNDRICYFNDAEHERLMRQAETLAPYTERLFRDAGIASGQRVLDVGFGVGDVALLAASLVGSAGSVLGIDRDAMALSKARSRAAAARASNVQFLETDLSQLRIGGDFDAIVGRFILIFLPDPAATLRSLSAHLRPGGVISIPRGKLGQFLRFGRASSTENGLCGSDMQCLASRRRPNGHAAYAVPGLLESGYPAPSLRVEVPVANDSGGYGWLPELIASLRPRFKEFSMETHAVGEFGTLAARLELERRNARSFAPLVGLVGALARKI